MAEVFIGLGANLGECEANVLAAIKQIAACFSSPILRQSRLYQTQPLVLEGEDPASVPQYMNAVVSLDIALPPLEILSQLHAIEREFGRRRELEAKRWQPRILDLDIIAIGTQVVNLPSLHIPHPEMHKREFVLEPLSEIAPDWQHPLLRKYSQELLDELRREENTQGY